MTPGRPPQRILPGVEWSGVEFIEPFAQPFTPLLLSSLKDERVTHLSP